MQFSRIHSSVTLERNQLIFAVEMPANVIISHSKFQLNRAKCFRDMNLRKLAEFLRFFRLFCFVLFFFFSSSNRNCHKTQIHYLIVLKFGTQQDGVSVHGAIKFGCKTVNGHKFINNYS